MNIHGTILEIFILLMNEKKIAVIGYGSIGKRHVNNILKYFSNFKIFVVSNQKIKNIDSSKNISDLLFFNPDFVIISNETYKHLKIIKFFEKNYKKIKILVEKPLFEKFYHIKKLNNYYYVGYNLRYHPIIEYLKKNIRKKDVIKVHINCNSFLPNWRSRNYKKSR